jgi:hypothetical protein
MIMTRYIDTLETGETTSASNFGPRSFENDLPAEYVQAQGDKVMELTFNAGTDTDTYTADVDSSRLVIPANSYIVSGYVTVLADQAAGVSNITLVDVTTGAGVLTLNAAVAPDVLGTVTDLGFTSATITVAATMSVVDTNTSGEATVTLIYRTTDDRTGSNQS